MSKGQSQTIDIGQLPVQALNQLSQQLDQEIEFLGNSLSQLKALQNKFTESSECVGRLTPENVGKDILVPLTGSMYVKGMLEDSDKVMIDIGTGYYVEMSRSGASAYFKRKTDYLTKQMEKLQPVLQEKYKMKQAVMETMQGKVQAQMMSQQSGATAVAK